MSLVALYKTDFSAHAPSVYFTSNYGLQGCIVDTELAVLGYPWQQKAVVFIISVRLIYSV